MISTLLNDRYLIEAELGRGGMGIVYQAQDKLLERPVAIKIVSATALSSEGRSRLLLEAQAAAKISHPNVVTIFDVGETTMGDEEAPVVPLAYPRLDLLIKPWIKNWKLVSTYDPFFPHVVIDPH